MNDFGLSNINNQVRDSIRQMERLTQDIQEQKRIKEEREMRMLIAAEKTAENTAVLKDMMGLIAKGNDRQEEIFEILVEILSISKEKTYEEAESKYRAIWKKIGEFKGDIETGEKLFGYAASAWKVVGPILLGTPVE